MAASSLMLPEMDAISPLAAISRIPERVPILILAGADDTRASPGEARQLWERISEHGRLVIMPGAEHLQLWQTDRAAYESHLLRFAEGCGSGGRHALDSTVPES